MPSPPAQCNACGAWFPAPGIVIEDFASLQAAGATVGPCDRCGGTGTIPAGTFRAVGDTLHWLIDVDDPQQIHRLLEAVRALHERNAGPDEVRQTLDQAAPRSGLSRFVPQNAGDVGTYLLVLIAALALWLQVSRGGGSVDQEQILDGLVEQLQQQQHDD